ncbi:hypothetical protein ABEY41_04915 [Peribacillus butanolivorans]|uniref:hypothetical protein n=1 Tax=Peribacillus TaxID=2675229 RepID=UPI000A5F63ED|nr:hypothetical protein [Peribacillus butanolivorans]QNU04841.1 hypothetical protein GM240_13465 [Peribacillus butanolivorans]
MKPIMTMDLQLLADVLKENNCTSLISAIAEKDFQVAQMLDVLIIEDKWGDDI